MKVQVGAITDTGQVRQANEDNALVDNELFIFAVADGMGGHNAGEIASAIAVETLRAGIASGIDMEQAIKNANTSVRQKAASDEEFSGMGTTITALGFTSEGKLAIAHVGDSRAYVINREVQSPGLEKQKSIELKRITKDHSLVEELVQAGEITEEEANVHPRRSVITRALGIEDSVEVEITPIDFKLNDRYLLCSDGLTSMVRDDEILNVLNSFSSPKDCASELVARANSNGGTDNITVIVLDVLNTKIEIPEKIKIAQSNSTPVGEIPKAVLNRGRFPFIARIVLSFLAVIILGFGIYQTTFNYAHNGYFLDQKNGQVIIMSGHLGGVLIWEPEIDTETGLEYKELSPSDKTLIKRHTRFKSRKEALKTIEKARLNIGITKTIQDPLEYSNTTSTSSTTTTIPAGPNDIIIPPPTSATGR